MGPWVARAPDWVSPRRSEGAGDGVAAVVALDDARVDVGGPADGGGVAEVLGDLPDHAGHGPAAAGGRGSRDRGDGQADRRQHGRVPGPEVLGADVQAGQVLEVLVDVRAVELVPAPLLVVGEQRVAFGRAGPQLPDDPAELRIGHRLDPLVAALGRVVEHDLAAGEADVLPAQRGQPEGAVVLRVALPADPEEAQVEQAERGREDPLPGQAAAVELGGDDLAGVGQRGGEVEDVVVLGLVPLLPPARVVEVLPRRAASNPTAWMCPSATGRSTPPARRAASPARRCGRARAAAHRPSASR